MEKRFERLRLFIIKFIIKSYNSSKEIDFSRNKNILKLIKLLNYIKKILLNYKIKKF